MDDPEVAVSRREPQMTEGEHWPLQGDVGPPTLRWQAIATSLLCLIGLGLSLYTLWVHYHPGALACVDAGPVDCQAVLTSPQSVVAGVPVPFFGVTFFVLLGVWCLPASWRSANGWVHRGRLAIVAVGIGSALYLVSVELFSVKKICLYCTGVHVVTLALFVIIVTTTAGALQRSASRMMADG
jgi:uncharacterized membrane protein